MNRCIKRQNIFLSDFQFNKNVVCTYEYYVKKHNISYTLHENDIYIVIKYLVYHLNSYTTIL